MKNKNKEQKFGADTEWRKDLLYIAWTKEYLFLHRTAPSQKGLKRPPSNTQTTREKAGPTSDSASFEVMRKFYDTSENGDYDDLVKKLKNPIVK